MIYIYCPRRSAGALELIRNLGATRLRKFDGMDFWNKQRRHKLTKDDVIVCWGSSVPEIEDVRVLNSLDAPLTKVKEIERLQYVGVPTVILYMDVKKIHADLLPRTLQHQGGHDLLIRPTHPDYQVVKEPFVKEFRLHSFAGRSIRAGVKVPREGFTPCSELEWRPDASLVHPWVRSFDAGWRVNYDGFKSTNDLRGLAHKAVKALNLTFGAVDIAQLSNGSLKVLEVNRAPGIDGNTIAAYTRAITRWMKEDNDDVRGVRAGAVNEVPAPDPEPIYDDDPDDPDADL